MAMAFTPPLPGALGSRSTSSACDRGAPWSDRGPAWTNGPCARAAKTFQSRGRLPIAMFTGVCSLGVCWGRCCVGQPLGVVYCVFNNPQSIFMHLVPSRLSIRCGNSALALRRQLLPLPLPRLVPSSAPPAPFVYPSGPGPPRQAPGMQ